MVDYQIAKRKLRKDEIDRVLDELIGEAAEVSGMLRRNGSPAAVRSDGHVAMALLALSYARDALNDDKRMMATLRQRGYVTDLLQQLANLGEEGIYPAMFGEFTDTLRADEVNVTLAVLKERLRARQDALAAKA